VIAAALVIAAASALPTSAAAAGASSATGVVPAPLRQAAPAAANPALEAQVMQISAELRCLVCQNQTIADSNADLAVDLRRQVREMLSAGQTEAQIIDYMTARYGDFVRYRPPVNNSTALLWYGPGVLLVLALATLVLVLRRRARLAPQAFEPDPDEVR
jgi:cytochrome c-type biogenesis protein CcmH